MTPRNKKVPLRTERTSFLRPSNFDLKTRALAGQVIRRILMAVEFLLRYLADVPRDSERWSEYLAERYTRSLGGHLESLRDRATAYLETLVRSQQNTALLAGYYGLVQLWFSGTQARRASEVR